MEPEITLTPMTARMYHAFFRDYQNDADLYIVWKIVRKAEDNTQDSHSADGILGGRKCANSRI